MSSLEALREILLAEGEPLAGALRSAPTAAPVVGPLAAAGPRAARDRATYELLLEAIYEGYLLHYDRSRLIDTSDPNLALLAGDRLYALGLERLVALGDLEAVRRARGRDLAVRAAASRAASRSSAASSGLPRARAVGYGASPAHERAKRLLREGSSEARAALASVVDPPAVA